MNQAELVTKICARIGEGPIFNRAVTDPLPDAIGTSIESGTHFGRIYAIRLENPRHLGINHLGINHYASYELIEKLLSSNAPMLVSLRGDKSHPPLSPIRTLTYGGIISPSRA